MRALWFGRSSYVNRVAKWEGSMEVRVRGKTVKKNLKGQQPKKVECGTMLVNAGSGVG